MSNDGIVWQDDMSGAGWSETVMVALELAGLPRRSDVNRVMSTSSNHIYQIGEDFIVRLGKRAEVSHFVTACEVHRAIAGKVPAPELIHSDLNCETVAVPFMVTEFVAGPTLTAVWPALDKAGRRRHLSHLVEVLVDLHDINFNRIPSLASLDTWAKRRRLEMSVYLEGVMTRPEGRTEATERMATFWADYEYLLDTAPLPTLIHNDCNPNNVIVSGAGEVRSIIDFDDADVAPWEIEYWWLCDALFRHQEPSDAELQQLLSLCYGFDAPFSLERRKLDEAFRLMRRLYRATTAAGGDIETEYNACFVEDRYRPWFRQVAGD